MAGPSPWIRVFPPENVQENESPRGRGPIHMPPSDSRPITYFYLLFSMDLMMEFVRQTNRYAKDACSTVRNVISRASRKNLWTKTGKLTIPEFKGFLAVLYNMGLNRKVSIKEYWNKKHPSQSTPWFRAMFARNRFQNILKFLRLENEKKLPPRNHAAYSPACRFQSLIDYINRKFMKYYLPRKELSIDESLVGTKGKTSMLQYIPSKRSRFGIKFWMLVESVTGYVLQLKVYRGKKFDPVPQGQLQGTNVVMSLLQSASLLNKRHHIFVDSFFTSLNLISVLQRHNTFMTGTVKKSRPMPKMIKDAKP